MPDGKFIGPCCQCRANIWLPQPLHEAARHSEKIVFYCPYGHPQVFADGETEADKLRRERDRLKQLMAMKDDEIRARDARIDRDVATIATLKKEGTKLKSRAAHGVCPCCNRQFLNMSRHMKSKHPEFKAKQTNGKDAKEKWDVGGQ